MRMRVNGDVVKLKEALRKRCNPPEWAIFFEVANGPGATFRRYADAVAMSLFPSRGLEVHGFEIKRDRRDWLRELKAPEKAETIASYCDYWWIVVPDKAIVKDGELPPGWGLLALHGESLRTVKKGKQTEVRALDRPFIAAMFRRAHQEMTNQQASDERLHAEYMRGKKDGKSDAESDRFLHSREYESLKREVKEFEEKSGISIGMWNGGRLGEAVALLTRNNPAGDLNRLERLGGELEDIGKGLKEYTDAFRKAVEIKEKKKGKSCSPTAG